MRMEIQKQQYNFVIKELKKTRNVKSIYNLKNINNNYSKYLYEYYYLGNTMISIVYLIQHILNMGKKRIDFFKKIVKWFQNPKKLNVESTQSLIYLTSFKYLKNEIIDIILKIDKVTREKNSYREYYIAYTELNKLRYIVPNFMMTYGQFKCLKPSQYVNTIYLKDMCKPKGNYVNYTLYERISGITLETYLNSKEYKYQEFVNIFIQILFALEIGQQECGFTHYDLHYDNIVLRNSKNIEQKVNINGLEYSYQSGEFVPVIIDYGHACVRKKINNKWGYIGYGDFPEYGMLSFMVSGYDMYKLMCFCIYTLNRDPDNPEYTKTLKMFHKIFNFFYGVHEPYNIFRNGKVDSTNISTCIGEFCKMGSYSLISNRTPSELIDFMNEYKIVQVLNNFQRNPIPYQKNMSVSNIIEKYTNSEVIQPKCHFTHSCTKLSSVYYYISNLATEIESNNNIHEHISLSLIYLLAELPSDSKYLKERQLLKNIPKKIRKLQLLCDVNKEILSISLKKSIKIKLNSKKRKRFLKSYKELYDLFQLYYTIKYNHYHFGNKFDVFLNAIVENKWNKIQQLSLRISRWYESLVYYQYVEYINNNSSNIFSDSYFESFDVLKF